MTKMSYLQTGTNTTYSWNEFQSNVMVVQADILLPMQLVGPGSLQRCSTDEILI